MIIIGYQGNGGFEIMKSKIRLIELFAGIGSQAKALTDLKINYEHYKVVEKDKYTILSYNSIHGTNFKEKDIKKINGKDLEIVNTNFYTYILTYSFPCQDLSIAGKMQGMKEFTNTRSSLLWEVKRLLEESYELPQILLMENVVSVHNKKNQEDFNIWCNFLKEKGYTNYIQDLNAKDYGIPQDRNRCFMISILFSNKDFMFPKITKLNKTYKDFLETDISEDLFLTDKEKEKMKEFGAKYNFAGKIIKKDYYNTITANYGKISGHSGKIKCDNNTYRILSPLETWRLMGFTDEDYKKAEKVLRENVNKNINTQLYKQAGNSIVVDVLRAIFSELQKQYPEYIEIKK